MDRQVVGVNIRRARIDKGFTQQQLAEKMGKANTSISSYESGSRPLSIDDLIQLSEILEVDIRTFFESEATKSVQLLLLRINSLPEQLRPLTWSFVTGLIDIESQI